MSSRNIISILQSIIDCRSNYITEIEMYPLEVDGDKLKILRAEQKHDKIRIARLIYEQRFLLQLS